MVVLAELHIKTVILARYLSCKELITVLYIYDYDGAENILK